MTKIDNPRSFRGIASVRADATDPNAVLAEINKAFGEFKDTNDANLKQRDAVADEKLDRINASMTDLEAKLKELAASTAAGSVGAGGSNDPAKAEYAGAFNRWFRKGRDEQALGDLAVKASLATDSDPDGGYVVTPEMDTAIDRVLGTVSVVRGLSRVVSVGTDEFKKLINQGGAGSGWVSEKASRPGTDSPALSEIVINAHEIYANPAATQKLLDDAFINIEQWLADEVSTEFAEQEGAAFVTGNGVGKPRGILGYTTVANSSYAWGKVGFTVSGAAAAFAATDPADALIDLYYALKSGHRNNATWLTSDAVMGSIRKFKDGDGTYLWAAPSGADMPATILGKPVATDDNMPALGANAFPVAFGDFNRAYLVLDRVGTRVLRDPYTNKPYVHFYTTKRVGGGIQNFEAIKLLKCST